MQTYITEFTEAFEDVVKVLDDDDNLPSPPEELFSHTFSCMNHWCWRSWPPEVVVDTVDCKEIDVKVEDDTIVRNKPDSTGKTVTFAGALEEIPQMDLKKMLIWVKTLLQKYQTWWK